MIRRNLLAVFVFVPLTLSAQSSTRQVPTRSGQDAFATIGEIVRVLDSDSTTDWSRVNMEALRQHLIDMNEVTLHSTIVQHDAERGLTADVTGPGRTESAIRRMLAAHSM